MPELALWQWITGAVCAFFIGVAKAGVPGTGIWVVPVMVLLVGDARQAAGWLLPILCTGDAFAVVFWRRHADFRQLLRLIPWVLVGLAIGAGALFLDESILRKIVAVIILAMLALYLRGRLRPPASVIPARPEPYGITAGIATTIANAAGPVLNLYLLSMRLPKREFLGTAAVFYFIINLTKIPIYIGHGLFSRQSLLFDLFLVPAVLAGAMSGRWLFHHIPQKVFEWIIIVFTVAATLLLFR